MYHEQDIIFSFIKENEPVEQSKIVKHMMEKKDYSNIVSARNSISFLLKKLKNKNMIYNSKIQRENHAIPINKWRTNVI